MSTQSTRSPLSIVRRQPLLAFSLKLDAVVTGATGVAYLALAGPLGDLFDLPSDFPLAIGAFLAMFSIAVWMAALRPHPWAAAVIAANLPWVLASAVLVVFDIHEPNTTGAVWVALQALVVSLFIALQVLGLRAAQAERSGWGP